MDVAPEHQYVGYPRKGRSDDADRIQALGYAEILLTWLVVFLMIPLFVPKDGLTSLGAPAMVVFAVYDVAASMTIFKGYSLLAKGGNRNQLIAVVPALAYCLGVIFLVVQYDRAGGCVASFFGAACIALPGRSMANRALVKRGLKNGASSFRRLALAVEERRRADQSAPSAHAELFSGKAPK